MLEVYIDAASAGNPGPSGIGIFIRGEGHHLKISEPIGIADNHSAEFQAFVRAMKEVEKLKPSMVSLRSDSKIVVASIEKRYAKKVSYKELLATGLAISDTFPLFFVKWIPDEQNKAADALAREAIHKNSI